MPNAPRKECATPGCVGTADARERWCETCRTLNEHTTAAIAKRPTANERGYSARWQRYTKRYLAANPFCVDPHGAHAADYVRADVVDHKIAPRTALDGLPLNVNPKPLEYHKLFWNPANHQPVCTTCHNRKTATVDSTFARAKSRPGVGG